MNGSPSSSRVPSLRGDLVGALRATAIAQRAVDDDLDARCSQTLGHAKREVSTDRDPSRPTRREEPLDDLGIELFARFRRLRDLLGAERVEAEDLARPRLLARAALLEWARDDDDVAVLLERDDRIGREETRHVIDVRELVPVGVKEERQGFTAGFRHGSASVSRLGRL